MRTVTCYECGKKYNYDEDGFCPRCGAFNQVRKGSYVTAENGDIVLMSPASAAFDQFKNFMERGNYFKKLVKEL